MSYINLIRIEAATAKAPERVAAGKPRLLWAKPDVASFVGNAGLAATVFSSLAWVFVCH